MSTKTLRKRIALVAVSALGFGLMSVIPASATDRTCTAVTGGLTIQAGVSSTLGTCTVSAQLATTADGMAMEVVSGPQGGVMTVTGIGASTFSATNTFTVAAAEAALPAATTNSGTGALNVVGSINTPGSYTVKFGTAAAVAITVLPASNLTTTLTASNNAEVYLAGTDSPVITISRNSGGVLADGTIKLQVLSAKATMTVGAVYGGTTAVTGVTVANSTNARTFTFASGTFLTSGSYSFTAFNDRNNNDVIDSGESTVAASFTLAAAAADLTVSSSRSTVADDTATSIVLTVCAVTSTGSATRLTSLGTATIDVDADLWTSATTAVTLDAAGFGRIATTGCYQTTKTTAALITAASVDSTITVDLDGSTTTTTDTGTAVVTSQQVSNGTSLVVTDQAGVTGDAASTAIAAGTALAAATTVTTFAFTAAGTAGNYVGVTVTAGASTSIAKSSITSSRYLVGADGYVTFPLTITGPAAADVFTVTLDMAADVSYVITYAAAAPAFTLLPGANLTDKFAATNTITATLADAYLRPYASATVIITVTGRNPSTTLATTDAAGKVSVTVKDVSTSTVLLTDTVTFSHSYLATATATANTTVTGARTITYSATGNVVGSVTVVSATGNVDVDQVQAIAGVPASGSRVTYTAQVRDASGNAVAAGVPVTFAGGADDLFYLGAALGVTDANGQATASVYRNKTGFAVITATAAGVTGAALPVKWINTTGSDDQRNVTIKAEPASVVSAGTTTITATVTDRWGNGVSGVAVTFAELGAGRLSATSAQTNSAGIAAVDFTSNAGETGSNTVSATIAGGQTSDLAGYVGATPVAGVTAGNLTISTAVVVTKDASTSTADALLALAQALGTRDQASATVDAAAEATDAANAATDAANAAAEAADAATAAAQDASDAVAALSAQVSEAIAGLKKQLVSLTNLVIKIQKKVKA